MTSYFDEISNKLLKNLESSNLEDLCSVLPSALTTGRLYMLKYPTLLNK